jgi:hypothetical protein
VKLGHTDVNQLRELLVLISMAADLRLYKWREWIGGEMADDQLASALDELIHNVSRYSVQLAELSGKLRDGA